MRMTATSPSPNSWLIVGDPADLRVRQFAAALPTTPALVDYRALLDGAPLPEAERVRLESPGRAADLHRRLVALGGGPDREEARGEIVHPALWYRGFTRLLNQLPRDRSYTSQPEDVIRLFDKRACHARLQENGIPVPRAQQIETFEDLRGRVFVKLRHGSAASGIVAYRRSRSEDQAFTTVEKVGDRLFNTRRLRQLRNRAEIATLVNALIAHEVHVEEWIPKAGIDGRTFDLRILVVAGEPAHAVVRLSKTPITNLHLLNERASIDRLPIRDWEPIHDTCRRVAALFPKTLHLALDVALTPDFKRHYVLEVNAFGDQLHGVTYRGLSTYAWEIACST